MVGEIGHQHLKVFTSYLKQASDYRIYGFDLAPEKSQQQDLDRFYEQHFSFNRCNFRFPLIRAFINYLRCIWAFSRLKKEECIIQFHFISRYTLPLQLISKLKGYKISSFVYGSDYMRSGKIKKYYLSLVFRLSDSIVCDSLHMKKQMVNDYPFIKTKTDKLNFGSQIIDCLYEAKQNPEKAREKIHVPSSVKYVIMCGYNASAGQNHKEIIRLIPSFGKDILWIFPMTYNGNRDYIREIENLLRETQCNYRILTDFIPDSDWTDLITATDIFIHIQISDAFSSSLAEHLLAGNVVINGEWLKYDELEEENIFYLPTSLEKLEFNIHYSIENYASLHALCSSNKEKIRQLKSWKVNIAKWVNYFGKLEKHEKSTF